MKISKNVLAIVCVVFISFVIYFLNSANALRDNKLKIQELEKENINLQKNIEIYKKDLLPVINLSKRFVEAHVGGDKQILEELLSDKFILKERDGNIFTMYNFEGENIEVRLYSKNSKYKYKDTLIQGYTIKNDIIIIHIREFYVDENNNPLGPPTFLNLGFKNINGTWKVVSLEFDI